MSPPNFFSKPAGAVPAAPGCSKSRQKPQNKQQNDGFQYINDKMF